MALQQCTAKVVQHTLLKGKYQWVVFELLTPPVIEFQAGQFVMLTVPGMLAKRSYSIASPPALKNQIDLLVDVSPQGDGSLYLQSLNPGEAVHFMAPAGRFVVEADPGEEELIFIATGSGISALRSMVFDLIQTKKDPRPIYLYWGLRHVEDIFWQEDFELLSKQYSNFHFEIVLSEPPNGWPVTKGHVTDRISTHKGNLTKSGVYLCGNQRMIQEVSVQLAAKGIPASRIHHERFF